MASTYKNAEMAERYLLTAIITGTIKPSECELGEAAFGIEAYRALYRAACAIEHAGMAVDLVQMIDRVGMDDLVLSIATESGAPQLHNDAMHYAGIVRENARRREAAAALTDAIRALNMPDSPVSSVCMTACDRLRGVLSSGTTVKTRSMLELVCGTLEAMEKPDSQPERIPTGMKKLDMMLNGGFKPTNFVVIGARPGVGKSALMLSMAIAAASAGRKVLYISLEMSDEENAQRTLTHISGISFKRFLGKGEKLTDAENIRISEGMEAYGLDKIAHYEASVCRVSDVRNMAAQMKEREGLDMICIDYVGLLRPEQSMNNRVNELGQITRDLKSLAMEMNVVVMAAAQLNRDAEKTGRAPILSDLRDSGSLEQDANTIIFLHEDGQTDEFGGKHIDVILAKNRQGQKGRIKAIYRGGVMRFAEVT